MSIDRSDAFIRSLGVEAYRVGGSVRDEILGRTPKDADYIVRGIGLGDLYDLLRTKRRVVTPLKDRQGQQFGWRVGDCRGIEITLPRKEWNDGSGRRMGIVVDPNLSLAEDAKRRDFTFNALYRPIGGPNPCTEMIIEDPTGHGIYDLQHRVIRTTHPGSFRDDPLRMLRALRFVSTLDADLADETARQMAKHYESLDGLTYKGFTSGTVYDEFSKLLMGQEPAKALREAALLGVLEAAMPELADMIGFEGGRNHDLTVDEHTFKAIQTAANVDAPLRVRWALLFHDSGKPESAWRDENGNLHFYSHLDDDGLTVTPDHQEASEWLWRAAAKRMNVDRRMTNDVATIILNHMVSDKHHAPAVWVGRQRVKFGDEMLKDILLHRSCDFAGKKSSSATGIGHMSMLEGIRKNLALAKVPTSVKELGITGHDIRDLGIEGPDIGRVLKAVLDEVVCDPTDLRRSREWMLAAARRHS